MYMSVHVFSNYLNQKLRLTKKICNSILYSLKAILIFFNQDRTISYTLNKDNVYYYKIHLGGKQVRAQLVNHFNNYPLLGYKNTKYLD